MTITSYAQNFEDVILWRVLRHVQCGFYVDIGAQDPVIDSVSLAFYEKGWRGIHVEPTADYASALRAARPDEEVIEAAIGATKHTITFFEFPDTGLSTGDELVAAAHEAQGHAMKRTSVASLPLSTILDAHKNKEVHWLKIDVEGMEEQVLKSWRPSLVRPWIVLVESTKPNSTEPSFANWHADLEGLGYEFVYFDGLNRFYLSDDHPELRTGFGAGPNVFDDFVLSGSSSSQFCARINAEAARLRKELATRAEEAASLSQALARVEEEVASLSQALARAEEEATLHRATLKQSKRMWEEIRGKLKAEIALRDRSVAAEQAAVASLRQDLAAEQAAVAALRRELEAVYNSTSWGFTAPLRTFSTAARWFGQGVFAWVLMKPGSRPRRIAAAAAEVFSRNLPRIKVHPQPTPREIDRPQSNVAFPKPLSREGQLEGSDILTENTAYDPLPASGESEAVRNVYWQLRRARRDVLAQRKS